MSDETGGLRGVRLFVPAGEVVQAGFFDDEELALVFQLGGERYLATTTVEALAGQLVAVPGPEEGTDLAALVRFMTIARANGTQYQELQPQTVAVARCRVLGPARSSADSWLLALNGRKGRRTCCVLTKGGTEVEVLDMDMNEDDEEEEDEEAVENDVDME